jgi:hypothetical protein
LEGVFGVLVERISVELIEEPSKCVADASPNTGSLLDHVLIPTEPPLFFIKPFP